jgi:hypothetical protein
MHRLAGTHVLGQQPLQRGQVDRLRQVVVEPALARAFAVALLAPARQRDQADAFVGGVGTDRACHRIAVHPGHADVQHDGIQPQLMEAAQRLFARVHAMGVHTQ